VSLRNNYTKKSTKIISSTGVCLGIYKSRELHKIYDEHFILRKPTPSLCIPREAIDVCEARGLELDFIVFNCKADHTKYKATIAQVKAGEVIDFGWGPQYRIPLINFLIVNTKGSIGQEHKKLRANQLSMFEGNR